MMSYLQPTALGYYCFNNAQSRKLSNLIEKVKIRNQNHVDSVLLGIVVYALHALHNVFTYFSSYFHSPFPEIYNIINTIIPLTTSRTENIKYSEIITQEYKYQ